MTRTRRIQVLLATLALLIAGGSLTAFQISEYPFKKKPEGKGSKLPPRRKVYLDQTDAEMKKIMKGMCEEIGAKCEECHNTKDFASFEKPMKEFAQYKMLMVGWLNAKYRPENATWKYTCYSCHRGVLRPLPSAPPPKKPGL